jgi:hypothetical protein
MKWNQFVGGILIGLGFGLFLGEAIVDQTQRWNSTASAGGCMLLVLIGGIACRRPGVTGAFISSPAPRPNSAPVLPRPRMIPLVDRLQYALAG